METRRVLSIQSHVVHGYVGNKAATFPLQCLGFDVDAINSVQLSNHTGYGSVKGQVLGGADIEALVGGLRANSLLHYDCILTGYAKNAEFLLAIAGVVQSVRAVNPRARYVCDPVLGDHGKFYVPPELVGIYRDALVPLATLLTPNQFEAEQLSGVRIVDVPSAVEAMARLHALGAKSVVITSGALPEGGDAHLVLLASAPWEAVEDEWETVFAGVDRVARSHAVFRIDIPRIDSTFTGSGDLTAALLLAHTQAAPKALAAACLRTIATVQAVCRRTVAHHDACVAHLAAATSSAAASEGSATLALAGAAASTSGQMGSVSPALNELRLVQSKADIETAPVALAGLSAVPIA